MSQHLNNPAIRRLAHSSARAAATLNAPSPLRKNLSSRLHKLYKARDEIIRGLKENGVNVWISTIDNKVHIGDPSKYTNSVSEQPNRTANSKFGNLSQIDEFDDETHKINERVSAGVVDLDKTWFHTKRIN